MKRKHLTIGIALLTGIAALCLMGQNKLSMRLGATGRSVVFRDFVGVATTFQNGFRPEWDFKQTWVRLYDSNGTLVRTNEVRLPGAESVSIWDVSVSKTGLVAVVASARSSDGAEAGTIVLFDQPGAARLVIRTNPFIPTLVAIAPDGYIWIAGTDPDVEFRIRPPATPKQKQELCVLQKYTATGLLVGSFLKRSMFDAKVYPWHGLLRTSTSGVGLYVPHADGSTEWVEVSLTGDIIGSWTATVPGERVRLGKIGFADSGSVYAEWSSNERSPAAGAYRLNKLTSTWDRLEDPDVRSPHGIRLNRAEFLGTDGDLLIFRTNVQPSHVVWFQEPPR